MSFLDKLRNLLAGPPHIEADDPEAAATLHEEFGAPDKGADDLHRVEATGDHTFIPSYGASESAEAAEDDLETEEVPADPDP